MQRLEYCKVRKAMTAALGVLLLAASEAYADNPWVQTAIAVATVLGVYQVRNDPTPRQG